MEWKLTAKQKRKLQRSLGQVRDAREYRRLFALLEVARGGRVGEVARKLGVTRQSVHNWLGRYRGGGRLVGLRDARRTGRPSLWTGRLDKALRKALAQPPNRCGYQAGNWTVELLQHYLEDQTGVCPSDSSLRRKLDASGYVWKRTRYVLEPDPEREKKTRNPAKGQPIAVA